MATIIISGPAGEESLVTAERIQLDIVIEKEDFSGKFDQLEVWRSRSTADGPYEELTAPTYIEARIPKTSPDPPTPAVTGPLVNIVDKILELRIDEGHVDTKDISVTFVGVDPLTFAEVATQITGAGLARLFSYVDEDGKLVVQTTETGTGAVLRVLGGEENPPTIPGTEAAPLLELPTEEPQSLAFGRDARLTLVETIEVYTFVDKSGSPDFFYRTRFRNSFTGSVSEFSIPFSAELAIGAALDNVVTGQLDLIGPDGKPTTSREVRIFSAFDGTIVDGRIVAERSLVKSTDKNGHVEFVLVRGMKATVAIIGTDLIKEIVVPTDPDVTLFNLFDDQFSTQDDYFKVVVPDVPFAERRSL
jgi:hypothetical protein